MTRPLVLACALVLVLVGVAARTAHAEPCVDEPRYDKPQPAQHHAARADDFLGKTAAALRAAHGEPMCASAAKWRFELPLGCAYNKDVVTVWFIGGKVSRVNIVGTVTGEECR